MSKLSIVRECINCHFMLYTVCMKMCYVMCPFSVYNGPLTTYYAFKSKSYAVVRSLLKYFGSHACHLQFKLHWLCFSVKHRWKSSNFSKILVCMSSSHIASHHSHHSIFWPCLLVQIEFKIIIRLIKSTDTALTLSTDQQCKFTCPTIHVFLPACEIVE